MGGWMISISSLSTFPGSSSKMKLRARRGGRFWLRPSEPKCWEGSSSEGVGDRIDDVGVMADVVGIPLPQTGPALVGLAS
jgi:hypothetical protein